MAEIEHASRPRSTFDEKKKAMDFPQHTTDEESPSRIEEGEKGGLLLSEEEAIARVKANPDDSTPIFLTWGVNDSTNPRNWPVRFRFNTFHNYCCSRRSDLIIQQRRRKWWITCFASFLNFLT
jgi:hypothetical protein